MVPKRPRGNDPAAPQTAVSRRDRIEPIPDTPENIARAIMRGPPKKEWRYLKGDSAGRTNGSRR